VVESGSVSASEVLREQEVLSRAALAAIENQREVRNTSQHIYAELSVSELRSAVLGQLETTPRAIQGIVAWVELLENESRGEHLESFLAHHCSIRNRGLTKSQGLGYGGAVWSPARRLART
jgi:hypothetical protein